jgi:hypothetical protein
MHALAVEHGVDYATGQEPGGRMNQPPNDPSPENGKPPTFWQMLHSVLAAALGVQSAKNRERDFTHGKPVHFAVLGLLFTLIFAALLFGLVQMVVYFAVG